MSCPSLKLGFTSNKQLRRENYQLLQSHRKFRTLGAARFILEKCVIRNNFARMDVRVDRNLRHWSSPIWVHLPDANKPEWHKFGLLQKERI